MVWARCRNAIVFLLFSIMVMGIAMSVSYIKEDVEANKLGLVLYVDVTLFIAYFLAACYLFVRKLVPIFLSTPSYSRKVAGSMTLGAIIAMLSIVSFG
jgi:hypothetical protein